MAKTIVNLTERVATQEIEKQLLSLQEETVELRQYQDLHQILITYVLRHLPSNYIVLDEQEATVSNHEALETGAESQTQVQVRALISQALDCLLNKETAPWQTEGNRTAEVCQISTWFG